MLKRLFLGLVIGVIIGGAAAFGLIRGLGIEAFGADGMGLLFGYASSIAVGLLTGLVAGKPIWSRDGKLEAGLKAFFGAALASAIYFALHRWAHFPVDLAFLKAGSGDLAELPATALPIVGSALGVIFELDNTPSDDKGAKGSGTGKRVAPQARVAALDEDEADAPAPQARRKR